MKTERISELIGLLAEECKKESVECIILVVYDGSSEIYQTMFKHSLEMKDATKTITTDPFFVDGEGILQDEFFLMKKAVSVKDALITAVISEPHPHVTGYDFGLEDE